MSTNEHATKRIIALDPSSTVVGYAVMNSRSRLIEWTKGKVGKRHHGSGAGLAVYGCGVGAIATECEHWCRLRRPRGNPDYVVIPVLENDWTRGVNKEVRQIAIAAEYPDYHISDDPGGDAADAIGLARWWMKEKRLFGK